jgi:Fe2+ transport system protein FeoA
VGKLDVDFFKKGALTITERYIGNIEHGLAFFCGREDTTQDALLVHIPLSRYVSFHHFGCILRLRISMKLLSSLPDNSWARVLEIKPGGLSPRLVEMGFCKGTMVRVLHRAPFNGPLAIDLGTSSVALRINEAELIWVESETGLES